MGNMDLMHATLIYRNNKVGSQEHSELATEVAKPLVLFEMLGMHTCGGIAKRVHGRRATSAVALSCAFDMLTLPKQGVIRLSIEPPACDCSSSLNAE